MRILVLFFLFGFCLVPTSIFSQILFSSAKITGTGSWPEVVAIGDVNNDGLNDVALATGYNSDPANDYKLFVFLQNGSGGLQTPVKYSYPPNVALTVRCISIGDVNNDLLNDVVIGYGDSIGIFYQNTSGQLNPISSLYSGKTVNSVKIGDLNIDGLQDIAVSHGGNNLFVKVFYQTVAGFNPVPFTSPQGGIEIDIADMNSDGLNDVVALTGLTNGGIYLYTQNVSGMMNGYITYNPPPSSGFTSLNGIALGDLNNDGYNDVVATGGGNSPVARIVFWNQDAVTNLLSAPFQIPAYDIPEPIEVADLNCDGRNELIVAHGGWMDVTVFEQNGSGQYGSYTSYPIPYASHYDPQGLAVGDFNNDGKKDVAIADYNYGLVTLLNISLTKSVTVTSSGSTSICAGSSLMLTANGGINYTWSPSASLNSVTGSTVVATPSTTTNYTVTSSTGCGNKYFSITVSVSPVPVASVSPNTTICSGSSATLSAGGGNTYSWSTGATGAVLVVSPTVSTTYSVMASNGVCSDDTLVDITVFPSPVVAISGNTSLCSGQTGTLVASGGGTYVWSNGSTNNSISISPSITTNYSITATSANGCADTANVNIMVTATPVATVSPDITICLGETISLAATGGNDYLWNTGETTTMIQLMPNTSVTYTVVVSNANCMDTASATITVNPNPTASAYADTTIYQGQTAALSASGGVIYQWTTGETTATLAVAPEVTTVYCVTVTDTNNCKDTACVTVEVKSPCDTAGTFYFPNAFSPNGDGENDSLRIYYRNIDCIASLHLIIYDRWGELVYETIEQIFRWDGLYGNHDRSTKLFTYRLYVKFTDGQEIDRKGNISLVR